MACTVNQHCASCIGTLSFPIRVILYNYTRKNYRGRIQYLRRKVR